MNKSVRNADFDFIKGILILLVIYGHLCMYFSETDYEKNTLTTYIRLFQMPLFIFISGYFQKSVISLSDMWQKLLKSIRHIIIPMGCWAIIAFCTKVIIYYFSIGNMNVDSMFLSTRGIISLFWYLGALFLCQIYYYTFDVIYNINKLIGIGLYIMGTLLLLFVHTNTFHFSFLWLFFLIGVICRKTNWNEFRDKSNIRYLMDIALITIVLIVGGGWRTSNTFYNVSNCILSNDGSFDIYKLLFIVNRYALYITSSYLSCKYLILMYRHTRNSALTNIIVKLGRETLFAYTFHVSLLAVVIGPVINNHFEGMGILPDSDFIRYYLICPLATICLAYICYRLSITLKKSRIAGKLLMGA